MNEDDIRERAEKPEEQLWWSWRYLNTVMRKYEKRSTDEEVRAVACFARIAAADPVWALAIVSGELGRGPELHQISSLLGSRLDDVLAAVVMPSHSESALFRGYLLSAVAGWQRDSQARSSLFTRSWQALSEVPPEKREERWKRAALTPASWADYPAYKQLAEEQLNILSPGFDRSRFLPSAISAAFRSRDRSGFDEWLTHFRALPEALTRDHSHCAILNMEGIWALEDDRLDDARLHMVQVIEAAQSATFLSNDDVSMLSDALKARTLFPDLTTLFDETVVRRDWRRLPKS